MKDSMPDGEKNACFKKFLRKNKVKYATTKNAKHSKIIGNKGIFGGNKLIYDANIVHNEGRYT